MDNSPELQLVNPERYLPAEPSDELTIGLVNEYVHEAAVIEHIEAPVESVEELKDDEAKVIPIQELQEKPLEEDNDLEDMYASPAAETMHLEQSTNVEQIDADLISEPHDLTQAVGMMSSTGMG